MSRRDALVASLLSASLVAWLVPFARLGVDFHHDGIMLKPVLDVLAGQTLFRDTFMQYGALSCYLQVVAFWIQPSLLSIRLMTVAAYGVSLFFLYASWRLILPRSLAILSCGLLILFIPCYEKNWIGDYWILFPWSSVFAILFQSIGLYSVFRVIRGEQPEPWGTVAGVACACVFWCRQPVGLVMFACLVAIWLALNWTDWMPAHRLKRSILVRFSAGFMGVNALMLGDILISGALPEWWFQNFIWPHKWMLGDVRDSFADFTALYVHPTAGVWLLILLLAVALPGLANRFRPTFSSRGLLAYFICLGGVLAWQHQRVFQAIALREGGWTALLPFVILVQAVISSTSLWVDRSPTKATERCLIAALAIMSVGSLLQYYPMADPWHILWSLAPTFGLFVYVVWRWVGWPAPVVAVVLTLAFLPALGMKAQSAKQALAQPWVTLARPAFLQGMRVPPPQAFSIYQIVDCLDPILRSQPDIPSALIGNDALFLCFTKNHANPSPYFVTWRGLADDTANQKRWNYILRVRPLLFLHQARWEAVNDFYRHARYVPLLFVADKELEIAVPQELAATLGLPATPSAASPGRVWQAPIKP